MNVSVKVFDGYSGDALDGVQLAYTCTGETCYLGETRDGYYNGKFPICLGGILGYIKEGYLGRSRILTTFLNIGNTLEVFEAIKGGKLRSKLFDDAISNIKDIDAKVAEKEAELARLGESHKEATLEPKPAEKGEGPASEEEKPE